MNDGSQVRRTCCNDCLHVNDWVVTPSGRVGEIVGIHGSEALVKLGEGEMAVHTYHVKTLAKFGGDR